MTEAHNADLNRYDEHIKIADWLQAIEMPSALVLTETLESVGGRKDIIFPPTYARKFGDHPYSIDELRFGRTAPTTPDDEYNTCLIDSVGSQANRMENCFIKKQEQPNSLSDLVPQIVVEADGQSVNVLEAGHRIADAAVRFSALEEDARAAIKMMADKGDALALARLAPTSLVFGFWDSRETGYKSGRLLSSTIRASNVAYVTRSAQFNPAFDPAKLKLTDAEDSTIDESGTDATDSAAKSAKDSKNPLSKQGLKAAPAADTHGGVRVAGEIVRRTQLSLVGLRSLVALADDGQVDSEKTMKLRRYILGLALVAARCQTDYKLREGCNLVSSLDNPPQAEIVYADGRREPFDWSIAQVFAFARQAAQDFGVQPQTPRKVSFSVEKVRAAVKKEESKKPKKPAGGKK
jgi:CRISPR-associated protein Csb1